MFTVKKFINTIKYLQWKQIEYRIYYGVRAKIRKINGFSYPLSVPSRTADLKLQPGIPAYPSYEKENRFCFLNITYPFGEKIDWNYSDEGQLWTFNLNYFDFINQEDISKEEALRLMYDFIDKIDTVSMKNGLSAYVISLRGMNWIKFMVRYGIKEKKIDDSLYAQYRILIDNLEYQFLANHLLENGFSLLYAAYYFQDETFYAKAVEILKEQLPEQTLSDGGNFELSPMYHQIILGRVLDVVNLTKNNEGFDGKMFDFLKGYASKMLSWIEKITFSSGEIPLLNDSAFGVAPTTAMLAEYAGSLEVTSAALPLGASGYRKIEKPAYEMVVDVAEIGASYNPAHAHSDTFTFELYVHGKPLIVDTGTSTYDKNRRRHIERSTFSHNTVVVGEVNQSNVWSGFRVAERAHIVELEERQEYIRAVHDGYEKQFGLLHERQFSMHEDTIEIIDRIIGSKEEKSAIARLHFHPDVNVELEGEELVADGVRISFKGAQKVMLNFYRYAPEYHRLHQAKVAEVEFDEQLVCRIVL